MIVTRKPIAAAVIACVGILLGVLLVFTYWTICVPSSLKDVFTDDAFEVFEDEQQLQSKIDRLDEIANQRWLAARAEVEQDNKDAARDREQLQERKKSR